MAYTRINWQDGESGGTPLSAENLNKMDEAIDDIYYEDSGWQNITYEHTYSSYDNDYNPLQYRKIDNLIFVRGMIKSTAINPIGTNAVAGTLPAGAKPNKNLYFVANNNDTFISINIDTNGGIKVFNTSTNWISLDGINFFTD